MRGSLARCGLVAALLLAACAVPAGAAAADPGPPAGPRSCPPAGLTRDGLAAGCLLHCPPTCLPHCPDRDCFPPIDWPAREPAAREPAAPEAAP
ncbi:hypothetical protein [Actinomadura rubrisoli]|uniref:Uncharacterized protein n=1 Tax=Actinomadura rubrisoli TaxID=2530368 RepID=A0A4V2YR56_9ACTN|nr:hypothetical protein [Actinomadura rubrisoli]TDD64527.1 hypothetical protein E1298_42305 [Actinomadura rubrisoli]